ncbi:hypothetical protein D3Y57_19230 [Sphingomonas paeninsulae]|uniref:DUF2846 domain-containing protein n=1 Tax=Sphingomonas paeninsulae TaxID=2319844 RepID=A0A494TDU5_SPHPE|nr:DUF2846 domain-containing protein [Sphingomonas paeninsulae]AYJ87667.1 hypothetical protein D3Y57_19230 [Sphingomonas paeninsulae]
MKINFAAFACAIITTPVMSLAQTAAPTITIPTATIIMYRGSSVMGAALGCPIRYKGQELVELGRGKYAEWSVPAGDYILTNKTASVDVIVAAGQTKYVRCQIKPGFMTGRSDLQIVDEESFVQHRADFEKKDISPLVTASN